MQEIALCTQHQKATWIGPMLEQAGYTVVECNDFDTDTLGTFSGEIPRTLSPTEAALHKAKMAVKFSGLTIGMGSEGSFSAPPLPGMGSWNEEVLCWYNSSNGQVIYASAEGPVSVSAKTFDSPEGLANWLSAHPHQRWIVKHHNQLIKGMTSEAVIAYVTQHATRTQFDVQPDLRAMHCPERQDMLSLCAQALADKLQQSCPVCQAPGFVVSKREKGLPCELCHTPTNQAKAVIKQCSVCNHTEHSNVDTQFASAQYCPLCNP